MYVFITRQRNGRAYVDCVVVGFLPSSLILFFCSFIHSNFYSLSLSFNLIFFNFPIVLPISSTLTLFPLQTIQTHETIGTLA